MIFTTLDTIVSDLLNTVRNSNISQSENISKRLIEDKVHEYRSLLLKRDLDKGKKPNPDYIQSINYLRLNRVDISEEDSVDLPKPGWYLMKSDIELPQTLDLNFKSGYTYIGTVGGDEIQFVPESRSKWQFYKKYSGNEAVAFLKDRHLYLIYGEPIQYISIRGIFEIPPEVGRFINPMTQQPYFNMESKYPIPNSLIPTIKEMVLKELGILIQSPTDNTNDNKLNVK